MLVTVVELLPIMVPPWGRPITVALDRLVATGLDHRQYMLDLLSCPLDRAEPVATANRWCLPQVSKWPEPALVLMRLGPALSDGLVIVGHVTGIFESVVTSRNTVQPGQDAE